jgi:hypothetical protein
MCDPADFEITFKSVFGTCSKFYDLVQEYLYQLQLCCCRFYEANLSAAVFLKMRYTALSSKPEKSW